MKIYGGKLYGGVYQDQPSSLIQYLDAADYIGTGSIWAARVGTDATLYNSPAWTGTGAKYFTFTPSSLQFADTPWLGNLSAWSVECWFNLSAGLGTTQATAAVCTVYDDSLGNFYGQLNYCLGNNNPSAGYPYMKAGYYNAINAGWHETNGFSPTVGSWYQVVGTFDGTTVSTYVNGALLAQAAGDGPSSANGAPTRIARRWDGPPNDPVNYFPGSIAIVKIFNQAQTGTEVQSSFNLTKGRFGL